MAETRQPHHFPVVSLEYVSKAYGDDYLDFAKIVLKNVSLTIQQGEFVIIYGPSGSGKSTLLNVIAGLETPSAGRVKIRSQDLTKYNEEDLARYHRRKMGMVFQNFNLIKSLNVWENVALPMTADGAPYIKRLRRAKRLLKLFGVDQYSQRRPSEISGGEQQRVAIARALVNDPLIMLVDEPTGNLDSKSADDVMRIFYGLHEHAKHTIVLVTHNPEYLHFASRVIHMADGEIQKQEWRESSPVDIPNALPKEHFEELRDYKHKEMAPGSLASAEQTINVPIGHPTRPAGIGAEAAVVARELEHSKIDDFWQEQEKRERQAHKPATANTAANTAAVAPDPAKAPVLFAERKDK